MKTAHQLSIMSSDQNNVKTKNKYRLYTIQI